MGEGAGREAPASRAEEVREVQGTRGREAGEWPSEQEGGEGACRR